MKKGERKGEGNENSRECEEACKWEFGEEVDVGVESSCTFEGSELRADGLEEGITNPRKQLKLARCNQRRGKSLRTKLGGGTKRSK